MRRASGAFLFHHEDQEGHEGHKEDLRSGVSATFPLFVPFVNLASFVVKDGFAVNRGSSELD